MIRLKTKYKDEIVSSLISEFNYSNKMQAPKIEKIVINMGVGEATKDSKKIDFAVNDLTLISGQKPVVTKAKKSISGFKIRDDMKLGCKVTLRGIRMYEFLDRLVTIALPRVRDFRGLSSKSFDKFGNYSFGIKEQLIFPEIDYDKIDKVRGMDITIVTTAPSKKEALYLLKKFELPIQ